MKTPTHFDDCAAIAMESPLHAMVYAHAVFTAIRKYAEDIGQERIVSVAMQAEATMGEAVRRIVPDYLPD